MHRPVTEILAIGAVTCVVVRLAKLSADRLISVQYETFGSTCVTSSSWISTDVRALQQDTLSRHSRRGGDYYHFAPGSCFERIGKVCAHQITDGISSFR